MRLNSYPLDDGGWLLRIEVSDGTMEVEFDADSDVTCLWDPTNVGRKMHAATGRAKSISVLSKGIECAMLHIGSDAGND